MGEFGPNLLAVALVFLGTGAVVGMAGATRAIPDTGWRVLDLIMVALAAIGLYGSYLESRAAFAKIEVGHLERLSDTRGLPVQFALDHGRDYFCRTMAEEKFLEVEPQKVALCTWFTEKLALVKDRDQGALPLREAIGPYPTAGASAVALSIFDDLEQSLVRYEGRAAELAMAQAAIAQNENRLTYTFFAPFLVALALGVRLGKVFKRSED